MDYFVALMKNKKNNKKVDRKALKISFYSTEKKKLSAFLCLLFLINEILLSLKALKLN